MSIGPVSGTSAFWPTAATSATARTAAPAAPAAGPEDFLASLAGGTGQSAGAGSQSAAEMLAAITDPSRVESAAFYNQQAMLSAFDEGSSGGSEDTNPFDMLSRNVAETYNSQLTGSYGQGVNSAGFDFLA